VNTRVHGKLEKGAFGNVFKCISKKEAAVILCSLVIHVLSGN